MPFKSKKQEQWAFATNQPFAKRWADLTNQSSLPTKVRKKKKPSIKSVTKRIETRR